MTKQDDALTPPEEMSFEDALEELEELIERIEAGNIGLEASLAARRRGEQLIGRCRSILDRAEQELSQVDEPDRQADADPDDP